MKRNLPLILLALAFAAIAAFSAYQLLGIYIEYRQGENTYDELTQYVSTPAPDTQTQDATEETTVDNTVWPEVDFDALKVINDDVVGWIYLEGTKVNYPIVRGDDNNYYLNRLYDGTGNGSGSIFMDYRNTGSFEDFNNIIYGHRMNNGTMFAHVANYSNHDFFYSHPYILIMTPEANYKVEVFSAYVATVTDPSWDTTFDSDKKYLDWMNSMKARSYFETETELSDSDRVVTLSTCTYETENARFVVHGILHKMD